MQFELPAEKLRINSSPMKIVFIILLSCLCSYSLCGQSIEPANWISSASYYSSFTTDNSLHSSFGEIATESLEESDQMLSQGFLQTYIDIVSTDEERFPDLRLNVGPNPCHDYFTLISNKEILPNLSAQLFDNYGRKVMSFDIENQQTTVDMKALPAATYFLLILHQNTPVFSATKIIKS